jgi:hypothetical protein
LVESSKETIKRIVDEERLDVLILDRDSNYGSIEEEAEQGMEIFPEFLRARLWRWVRLGTLRRDRMDSARQEQNCDTVLFTVPKPKAALQAEENAEPQGRPLDDFDFSVFHSREFKEDSVREEIILPILQALGYSSSGPNRIIRSKGLEHPFLTVGSGRRPITLIPEYLLTVDDNFTFTLGRESTARGDQNRPQRRAGSTAMPSTRKSASSYSPFAMAGNSSSLR